MSDNVKIEEKIDKINHFTQQLVNSGYGQKQCKEIVLSMLKGITRKEERRKDQKRRYLSAQQTLEKRNMDKLTESTTWYRVTKNSDDLEKGESRNFEKLGGDEEKKDWKERTQSWKSWRKSIRKFKEKKKESSDKLETGKIEVEKLQSVIFVQHTPFSELAKRIRKKLGEREKVGKIRIKIVERTGDKLSDILCKSDAWDDEDCCREDCIVCESAGEKGKKGACKKRNVI